MNFRRTLIATGVMTVMVLPIGCTSPLERGSEEQLRDQVLTLNREYTKATQDSQNIQMPPNSSILKEMSPERIKEIDSISGPNLYRPMATPYLGPDLMNRDSGPPVQMSLQRAIQLAVQHNIEVLQARLLPAATEAQIIQADAVFDAILYVNIDEEMVDTPRPDVPTTSGLSPAFGSQFTETTNLTTGIKKKLYGGGQIKIEAESARKYENPSIYAPTTNQPDFAYVTTDVLISLQQPLLRGFGADIARKDIYLAQNARDQANHDLETKLLQVASDTEKAYWDLYFARQRVLIAERLYSTTNVDRDVLKKRLDIDVKPATLAEVDARVEQRNAENIRSRQNLRLASDTLKRLINDPQIPLAGETIIEPLDLPPDGPMSFSLLDSITTAMQQRPEIKKALSQIDDASIRQRVADNGRLPQLDMNAAIRYSGIGSDTGNSFDNLPEGHFIDYIIGAQFEMPIGNREAEAAYQQRFFERHAAVLNYQKTLQEAVENVKDSLRDVLTAYQLITATRASRQASAETLRALVEEIKAGASLTPEFIDLKLRREDALADAELQEVQSLTAYNTAIAKFYQSMGTLLARDGIDLVTAPSKTE